MDDLEKWVPIPGYEGYYEASSFGRIRSLDRCVRVSAGKDGTKAFTRKLHGGVMRPYLNPHNGYFHIFLSRDGIASPFSVHEIIALTFKGSRPLGFDVCHSDGNRLNCREDNLRYGTRKENFQDSQDHGVLVKGETHPNSKLTEVDVWKIRHLHGSIPLSKIAERFGVSKGAIQGITEGMNWKHLTQEGTLK